MTGVQTCALPICFPVTIFPVPVAVCVVICESVVVAVNVAMDVARTALREGSREVIVIFRAGEEHVEADKVEVEYAKLDGVKFSYYSQPLEIIDNGIRVIKTEIKKAEDGIDTVYGIEGSEEFIECDSVVIAIGQGPRTNIVSSTKGIEVNNRGLLATDSTGKTSREGVFASGDVVTGAKTVVEAVKVSKLVAEEIDRYINSL